VNPIFSDYLAPIFSTANLAVLMGIFHKLGGLSQSVEDFRNRLLKLEGKSNA